MGDSHQTNSDRAAPTVAGGAAGDMADHISAARQRARHMLGTEGHLGEVDDLGQALIRARDAILLTWLWWLALIGFGVTAEVGPILVVTGVALSIFLGLNAGSATRAEVAYYESELARERHEIQTTPEHEREEVRALYASKGFRPPLLDQVVDTLCADDDRLLKVMMEEELGLFIHRLSHPVLVGLYHAGGSLAGALLLAVPLCWMETAAARWWLPIAGSVLLGGLALIGGRARQRAVPIFASWVIIGGITGGVVHFLSRLLAEGP
ncbi:MAG: hypothetical protein GY778_12705 [bacterium]|nr:hypothetical protein [bacterium]